MEMGTDRALTSPLPLFRRTIAALVAAARAAGDEEACGLLIGPALEVRPCANVAADRTRHFEIDPAALVAAHRAARAGGEAVAGYFHSHPAGPPEPSPIDRAGASGDGRVWAIVGLRDGAWEIGWFRDTIEGFTVLPTRLVDG